jgi:aspartate aminotransferase
VDGIPSLKDAIAEKLRKDNGLTYTREEIIVSCGAKHSLYNIAQALYGEGDEVIIPAPYWVSYPDQVILNDAEPVFVRTHEKDEFMVQPGELEKHISKRTKALILNYPSNPTGFTYRTGTLKAIAELAVTHDFYVVADEIYEKLLYDGLKHTSIASLGEEIKKKTLLVNGLSKSHAMTGWRIGYTAGSSDVIKAMGNVQSQSTSNPTSIAQAAAVEALTGPQDFIRTMLREFDKRRKFLITELNKIMGITCTMPNGAFYAFPNVQALFGKSAQGRKIQDSAALASFLLEDAHIALVPGSAFGAEGYIRMSYATSMENIEKGVRRLRSAIEKLA